MTERPTPETDSLVKELNQNHKPAIYYLKKHARKLERERDEMRDMVEKLTETKLDLLISNKTLKHNIEELCKNKTK
jgi:prefoldin subunit 5